MASRKYKKRRRKKRGGFILSLFTFLIIIGAIVASVTVFLKVADVQVTGTTRYNSSDIVEVSGIETGDNMFLINKFEVAERILDKFPYIEQIKIRRRLPDTFTFEITERVPCGYIEADGNKWLIDSNAYILERIKEESAIKGPKITGGDVVTPRAGNELILKNPDQLPVLKEVLATLRYSGMVENITRVELAKLYDINVVYANRFMVTLGDTTQLSKKIEMLRAVVEQLADYDKGTINVSAVKEARYKPDNNIDLSEKTSEPEKVENTETEEELQESAEEKLPEEE